MVDISIAIFIKTKPLHKSYRMMQFKIYIVFKGFFLVIKNAPSLTNGQKSIQQFAIFEKKKKQPNR